ncbi:DUF554 domain-containing protein [Pampinifervens florentissimum]|uniref:DUF554 domain-containing protein n=1 Tax=Pampinifervens florentissimum TaxID=1632019 RepID=UPI0013B49413|nr:DUF554 domain-containing protein [Hydrogenobacter sp. T-8]QID32668.1 DUF554 domain-containing protein [Hydrogenobacter sp. T-8]
MFPTFGTLVNAGLVVAGASVGLFISRAVPERLKVAVLQGIGLFTLTLGVKLISENKPELLKVFFLLVVGSLIGSFLRLEERLENLIQSSSDTARGFISASLLFTVGPMTLMGCILEGARGDSSLILSKAFMDGFSSIILSSSLGKGVVFSAVYLLFFQGSITLLAYFYGEFLKEQSMANALFIGGGLMVLTSMKILDILKQVRVLNLMPALVLALFF